LGVSDIATPEMSAATVRKAERCTRQHFWGTLLLSLLQLSAGVLGFAQSATPTSGIIPKDLSEASLEDLMNMKVYSASRYDQSLKEAPASVTIVSRDEIEKYGYRTLGDILRSVPGLYVTSDRMYSYVGVRGFAVPGDYNTRVLMMIDGHRLNDALYDQAMIGNECPVDVDMMERVEVIRGPVSSLYGTNAIFGVVNVITRKSEAINGVELSSDAGSFNSYRGRASYGGTLGGIATVVSVSFFDSKGHNELFYPAFANPENNNGFASHVDQDHYTDLLATLVAHGFTFQGVYGNRNKTDPTGSWDNIFNDPRNQMRDIHEFLDLRYEHALRAWSLTARTYFDRYARTRVAAGLAAAEGNLEAGMAPIEDRPSCVGPS
jgi:outer membrane receptor for ferrienterochelin and colicins